MNTRRNAADVPTPSTTKQSEQRDRAQRMAAELREHRAVRKSLSKGTAKLKAYAEGGGSGVPAVNLRNGLAARVDAILSRKVEDES